MSDNLQKEPSVKKEKTCYSDVELQEFKDLIVAKFESAKNELDYLQDQIKKIGDNNNSSAAALEDGTSTLEKAYLNQMASRQVQYIKHLENALIRIENKVYGICRKTGKLIGSDRLRAVPHATLSIAAKLDMQNNSNNGGGKYKK